MKKEIRVYLYTNQNIENNIDLVKEQAEQSGQVYSLRGFQAMINDGSLNLANYLILITD